MSLYQNFLNLKLKSRLYRLIWCPLLYSLYFNFNFKDPTRQWALHTLPKNFWDSLQAAPKFIMVLGDNGITLIILLFLTAMRVFRYN